MGRGKESWIEHTGGRGVGETQEQFQRRSDRIREIREKADNRAATSEEIAEFIDLSSFDDSDETTEW